MAALRAHHEEALLRLQLENEQLGSSYQALEEEMGERVRGLEEEREARVRELEGELGAGEERRVSEAETLQARIAELAESHAGEIRNAFYEIVLYIHSAAHSVNLKAVRR